MQRSRTYRQQGAPPENKTGEIPPPTVGMPTLKDILQELEKPGRDPRGPIKIFEFDKNVRTINDLREGMELPRYRRQYHQLWRICRHRYQREWSDPSFAAGRPFRFRPE